MSEVAESKEEDLKVKEEMDGSAVVDLPDDIKSPDAGESEAEGGSVKAESSTEDNDHPDDSDEVRQEKINRRKLRRQRAKQDHAEKDIKLQQLERVNRELMERLSNVERRTHGAELARVDKAIEDAELQFQYAKLKLGEATQAGDGDALVKAQEMWYEARQKIESLKSVKTQAVRPTNDRTLPDPQIQRNAADWMSRNDWYRPDSGDEDTEIAKIIDKRLVEEGWDPKSPAYWDELDNRLQRRLPHRYNDSTDDEPVVRQRPRNVVTSSGRESSAAGASRNTFTLNPEQVRAMKDAGFWDDPQKRAKMIKRYAMEARSQRSN